MIYFCKFLHISIVQVNVLIIICFYSPFAPIAEFAEISIIIMMKNQRKADRSGTPTTIRTPRLGQIWTDNANRNRKSGQSSSKENKKRVNFQNSNPPPPPPPKLSSSLLDLESFYKQSENIEDRPTSIYLHNNRDFLHSLRNFNEHPNRANYRIRTTSLARYLRMSREIVDDFVRLKTDEFENTAGRCVSIENSVVDKIDRQMSPLLGKTTTYRKNANSSSAKKRILRPKSAALSSIRRRSLSSMTNGVGQQRTRLNDQNDDNKPESFSDEEIIDNYHNDIDEHLKPLFHRSMDKISSIANWERQIRYELEIEKELQKREQERQKEKLENDQRKLEDWDKQLRIELDARERKLRLGEDELKSRMEEYKQKTQELMRREQMIDEIVAERIKAEMKLEIEKLRKKFNELEVDKSNLIKKEERVKELEARLHEQVKIVKEKIDRKRLSDMELAKYRKELEITKQENEVLKEKVNSMEDYQLTKFENRAIKSELQILKENLDNKNQEFDRDRERWNREQRSSDQKIMALQRDVRKAEQELFLLQQKSQADHEEISSKYEAANGQIKRLQAFIKDHLAKLNHEYSTTTQTMNRLRQSTSQTVLGANNPERISHHRGHSLHHMPSSHHSYHNRSFHHQRSVSMDGFHKPQAQRSSARGCRMCNDDEFEYRNGFDTRMVDCIQSDQEEEEEEADNSSCHSFEAEDNTKPDGGKAPDTKLPEHATSSDEFVRKIVDQIYEKMSNKVPNEQDIESLFVHDDDDDDHQQAINNTKIQNGGIDEKSLVSHLDQSLKLSNPKTTTTTHLHRTLYEELLIASELETSKKFNITNNADLGVDHEAANQQLVKKPSPIANSNSGLDVSPSNQQQHNNNDTNNNRINAETDDQHKNEIMAATMISDHHHHHPNHNNARPNSGDSHSTKTSESFEIDW